MRFVLKPPSLEQRALVKMAVSLWNQNDVRALIYPWNCWISEGEWKEIEEKVTKNVAQLSLPQLLNKKLSCFVQTIGLQICKWIDFHSRQFRLPLSLPFELCWTAQGTVDRKRTAELLVRDNSLDISTRYKLACVYCLEDDIMALWNTLSEDLKESNHNRYSPIGFWSRTMKGRGLGNVPISYKAEFVNCAAALNEGNKAAVQYFLQKLTPREREASLVEAAKRVMIDADTLCLLLSEMDVEQQTEVFKNNPRRVLDCFLEWPWQSLFMEIANCMWDFLSKEDYDYILRDIIDKVKEGYKDCNYQKLFREFWQKSPEALKSWITNDLDKNWMLPVLFRMKDKEIIRLILQDATRTAREKLIYCDEVNDFFQDCICDDEWDYLEIFIRECFPSKDLMLRFKEVFEKRDDVEDDLVRNKDKWAKLFLSSEPLREYEKRTADEGETSSSKKFRNLQ